MSDIEVGDIVKIVQLTDVSDGDLQEFGLAGQEDPAEEYLGKYGIVEGRSGGYLDVHFGKTGLCFRGEEVERVELP